MLCQGRLQSTYDRSLPRSSIFPLPTPQENQLYNSPGCRHTRRWHQRTARQGGCSLGDRQRPSQRPVKCGGSSPPEHQPHQYEPAGRERGRRVEAWVESLKECPRMPKCPRSQGGGGESGQPSYHATHREDRHACVCTCARVLARVRTPCTAQPSCKHKCRMHCSLLPSLVSRARAPRCQWPLASSRNGGSPPSPGDPAPPTQQAASPSRRPSRLSLTREPPVWLRTCTQGREGEREAEVRP